MVISSVGLAVALGFSSLGAACLGLYLATWLARGEPAIFRPIRPPDWSEDCAIFLFDRHELVDASKAGERFLAAAPKGGSEWSRLLSLLAADFPDFVEHPQPGNADRSVFEAKKSALQLVVEWSRELCRIKLIDDDIERSAAAVDVLTYAALENELEMLRKQTEVAPGIAWRQDKVGHITWVNQAYVSAVDRFHGPKAAQRWPTPALFDTNALNECITANKPMRAAIENDRGETWYNVEGVECGEEILFSATKADQEVRAVQNLKAFTQTFTRTFADLTVGLAIFDRARRLVMFNPALSDLTELPVTYLVGNPSLQGVLDTMRDLGRVPEPRNYTEWRETISSIELGAADGHFQENWSLPSGQTIRVTGRPHPDGALAIIFEDISAEMSLTRRFRAELEAGRSVLDHFDEAVAVFSNAGTLTMSNAAYAHLWGSNPMSGLGQVGISDATRVWADLSLPTRVWEQTSDFIHTSQSRRPWSADITMIDGRAVTCRCEPLSGGATLVGFTPHNKVADGVLFRRRAS